MNFDYDDDQQTIRATAAELLTARFKPDVVRALAEARRYDDAHWSELRDLGWPGIFVSEECGGQGLGTIELVILAECLGYALAPTPFLSNAWAGLVIQAAGSDQQKARWLPGIASGEATGTLAIADGLVPDAVNAAVIVTSAGRLHSREDAEVSAAETIDPTRQFARVTLTSGEPLPGNLERGLDLAEVALAAELVGVAQRALEMSVAYAKEREQFGRPIGAYQAVAHRCAQMWRETESARSTVLYAAWAADHEPETLPMAAAMAKIGAAETGRHVTQDAIQVHGGIGFTWEHDLHFLLKRAQTDAALLSSARSLRDRVAGLAGLR